MSHVGAIGLVNSHGQLVNLSRYWPLQSIDLSDRDYFKALKADATMRFFIGEPVQNRVTGSWTIVSARRVNAANGDLLGLVFGSITLAHFERFFQSISLQDGAAFTLIRQDGMLLARYPSSDHVGKTIPLAANI